MPFDDAHRRAARHARVERVAELIVVIMIAGGAAACTSWLF